MSCRRVVNAALALALIAVWGLILFLRPDPLKRNFRFIPQMEDPLAYEAQREPPPGAGGGTRGAAVKGTIARGFMPLRYQATPEDAARAGRELRNPIQATPEALRRGAAVYSAFCFPCHGGSGLGDGPVAKRGVPPPPPLSAANALNMPDGRMFHVVSFGQRNMPPYASQVERDDRWRAILYVRSLQAASAAKGGIQP